MLGTQSRSVRKPDTPRTVCFSHAEYRSEHVDMRCVGELWKQEEEEEEEAPP